MPPTSRPDSPAPRRTLAWRATALRAGVRQAASRERLLLAAKSAFAAGLAWIVAQYMPGPAANYPYYAPLGALVSMYPTVADSLQKGLQSLLGLTLGIGVAIAVGTFSGPTALAVALVVGTGVLVGGLPRMGSAADWVPMAALFVLVIGVNGRDEFSLGYLLQMAAGVAIGFAVNWFILPPLHYRAVTPAFRRLRHALAGQLEDMAAAMTEPWPPSHQDWAEREGILAQTAAEVRAAVDRADLSARANPRRRRHRRDLAADLADLRAVERATFQVEDITDVLSSVIWDEHAVAAVPPDLAQELADALAATGTVLRTWGESDDVDGHLDSAQEAIDALAVAVHGAAVRDAPVAAAATVSLDLARIVRGIRSRTDGEPQA
ncbi:FUSC family protein [Sinomonas atrocyanea]|uniref:FUSC family protein n=1 Tax=Sinomonas atrocyanea TaxID=37927 RepID=UPI003D95E519